MFCVSSLQESCCLTNLRVGSDRLQYFWNFDFESIGQFVEYLLPVYSGQPSMAETIIASIGLCHLFSECSNEEGALDMRDDLRAHALTCGQNLEATLSRLPFNLPSTFDYVFALFQAVSLSNQYPPHLQDI